MKTGCMAHRCHLCHLFRAKEISERTEKLQDEISQLDLDLEEHHGERTAKYKGELLVVL